MYTWLSLVSSGSGSSSLYSTETEIRQAQIKLKSRCQLRTRQTGKNIRTQNDDTQTGELDPITQSEHEFIRT